MASINKVFLMGRLGKDPEFKTTENWSIPLCKFSLATNEKVFDEKSQKEKELVEWHQIIAWGKLAELCQEKLKKGNRVFIEGKIKTKSWEDKKSGQKHYKTEIEVISIENLEKNI